MMPAPPSSKKGFLLLEVVLALSLFGMAATGFAVALNRMAKAADLAQNELRLTRILDSALDEGMSIPVLEEGTISKNLTDSGIEIETQTSLLKEITNQEGQELQEMYLIKITAHWYENGAWQDRSVETWRYGRMYQP